jgi:Arc/MetJ-type ribon-helix-helix transcriptional regulator
MKSSVSLTDDDVAILDRYAEESGLRSRSAALHHAIRLLRTADLDSNYAQAWQEWEESGNGAARESSAADGIDVAAR